MHARISGVPHRDDEETWTEWVERAVQDAAIDEVRVKDLRAAASTVDEAYETGSVTVATLTKLTLLYKGMTPLAYIAVHVTTPAPPLHITAVTTSSLLSCVEGAKRNGNGALVLGPMLP